MKVYTHASLNQGSGVFDHLMRTTSSLPSRHSEMPTEVAVGFLAAAMHGGLEDRQISELIESSFNPETADLLRTVCQTYDGPDSRIHLWEWGSDGMYRLHQPLQWKVSSRWTLDRYAVENRRLVWVDGD